MAEPQAWRVLQNPMVTLNDSKRLALSVNRAELRGVRRVPYKGSGGMPQGIPNAETPKPNNSGGLAPSAFRTCIRDYVSRII